MNVLGRGVPVDRLQRMACVIQTICTRPLGLCPQCYGVKPMSLSLLTEPAPSQALPSPNTAKPSATPGYQVIRRNGAVTPFDASKIAVAMTKAFLAVEGNTAATSRRVHDIVTGLTDQIVASLTRRTDGGRTFHIEDVQDQVELVLMRNEHHKVARAYVLYREERAKARAKASAEAAPGAAPTPLLRMRTADGSPVPLDSARLAKVIAEACGDLDGVSPQPVLTEVYRNLYDGISLDELALAPILAARTLVEIEPNYSKLLVAGFSN